MPQALVSTPEPLGGYYVIRDLVGGIRRFVIMPANMVDWILSECAILKAD